MPTKKVKKSARAKASKARSKSAKAARGSVARPSAAKKRTPKARGSSRPLRARQSKSRRETVLIKPRAPKRRPARAVGTPRGPSEFDTIKLAYLFRAPAMAIYRALTDSQEYATFTGDRKAKIEAIPGGRFQCFDGFLGGTVVEVVPGARLVQKWRTKHFPALHPDSTVEITLTPVADGTRLDMRHIDVPKEQVPFLVDGWVKYYWGPLAKYLAAR